MNNKGLTLVEIIAVLVILSIIAVIVTPNIAISIREYKTRMTDSQLSTIEGATKNWVADNIDKVPTDGSSALLITISELQSGAYLDEKLKNPNGGYFDDSDAFGLVFSKEIKDDTNNIASNYKYEYGAYLNIIDYEKRMAIEYVKDNGNSDTRVTTATLKSKGYIYNTIKNTSGNNVSIPSKTITVKVSNNSDGSFNYETVTD